MFLDFIWSVIGKIVFFTGAITTKNSFPKPLPKAEEERYLALAAKGDKQARDILVKHNMRLVAHIVKKYAGAAETDDLIERVGFRCVEVRDTQIYLNGEPMYMKGFNRHEDYAVDGCAITLQHMVQDI